MQAIQLLSSEQSVKRCRGCGEVKPVSAFSIRRASRDGLACRCRACGAVAGKAWRKANPERKKASDDAWRGAHPGHSTGFVNVWRVGHPLEHAASQRRGNAKQRGCTVFGPIPVDFFGFMAACFGPGCLFPGCAATERLTQDHVVPIKVGGTHTLGNVQVLCRLHNNKKHASTIDYRKATTMERLFN